jgi:shikimate kinase
MKLLVIYGPPSAGKLTVSNQVAARTDFRVFHNHLTSDLYKEVLEFGTPEFWDKVFALRKDIIQTAVENDVNLIFTFCYNPKPINIEFIKDIKSIVSESGGETYFVRLDCEQEELLKRVESDSRKSFGKLTDKEKLLKNISEHDYSIQIDSEHSIYINNTTKPAQETAEEIIKTFGF